MDMGTTRKARFAGALGTAGSRDTWGRNDQNHARSQEHPEARAAEREPAEYVVGELAAVLEVERRQPFRVGKRNAGEVEGDFNG